MNLVDSSGWLEYFADGPRAGVFAPALKDIDEVLVPTICIYEVFKVVLRQRGEEDALQAAALMKQGEVIDLTPEIAMVAARIGIELGMPMADSIIVATARMYEAVIWTLDSDFKKIEGTKYFSRG